MTQNNKQLRDKAIEWWNGIGSIEKLQLLNTHIDDWDNDPIDIATDIEIQRTYMKAHGLYDTFIAVFNSHIGDALTKSIQDFKSKYSVAKYKKEIQPFVDNGIMAIFNQKPNEYTQYFADTITDYVNEEKMKQYLLKNHTPPPRPIGKDAGEFTSGKWEVFIQPVAHGTQRTINVATKRIATLEFTGNIVEDEANAKLIAAAPAMYKALKELISEVQSKYGKIYIPNSVFDKVEEAKAILNNIDNK